MTGPNLLTFFVLWSIRVTLTCDTPFDGFGVHLGSLYSFNETSIDNIEQVLDKVYFELNIRHFRTSYEPYFSPVPGQYSLECKSEKCTWSWAALMDVVSNKTKFKDVTFMASIWSPPYHLMDMITKRLRPDAQADFHYFLNNITELIEQTYGIQISKISPVNEPENVWAPWDHCNMSPAQLCGMLTDFNDSLISLCPENAYFWMTDLYLNYKDPHRDIDCHKTCQTVATHAYALNTNSSSPFYGLAYYDLTSYSNPHLDRPLWVTEVSSTYYHPDEDQVIEAFDLATSIINFLGTTCVSRYYFWSAFTLNPCGESLIWTADDSPMTLRFPKKYFVFNHFTNASLQAGRSARVKNCKETGLVLPPGDCLTFSSSSANVTVFLNRQDGSIVLQEKVKCPLGLCCTTPQVDLFCNTTNPNVLPPQSVCSCKRDKRKISRTEQGRSLSGTKKESQSTVSLASIPFMLWETFYANFL